MIVFSYFINTHGSEPGFLAEGLLQSLLYLIHCSKTFIPFFSYFGFVASLSSIDGFSPRGHITTKSVNSRYHRNGYSSVSLLYIYFGFLVIILAVLVVAVIQKFKYFQNNVVYTIIMYNYCSLPNRIVVSTTEL